MKNRYYSFVKFLHWAVVALVAVQFISAGIMPEIRKNVSPDLFVNLHMAFGIILLPFVIIFFCTHFYHPSAGHDVPVSVLLKRVATTAHYMIYLLLGLTVLSGWAFASARGWDITLFGSVKLPALFATGSTFGHTFGELHSLFTSVLVVFILGHIGAALYHHYILKDSIMKRMMPHFK